MLFKGQQRKLKKNKKALATVTGIIDGTGSFGAAVGQVSYSSKIIILSCNKSKFNSYLRLLMFLLYIANNEFMFILTKKISLPFPYYKYSNWWMAREKWSVLDLIKDQFWSKFLECVNNLYCISNYMIQITVVNDFN